MMKKKIISSFLFCGLLLLGVGCSDALQFDESTGNTKEAYYQYFNGLTSLVSGIYGYLPCDYGTIGGALREAATDNAVFTWENNKIYSIYNNTWSAINTIDDVWASMYTAIRASNSFLENFDLRPLQRFEYDLSYQDNLKKAEMYPYEVRFLRAFFYFELIKRYNDVPLLTKTYTAEEIKDTHKSSFNEVVDFIASECDSVAEKLPLDQKSFYNETGRATKGAALALKSRALLYAASKLHNPEHDSEKWKRAAQAANAVIKLNQYSLQKIGIDPLYAQAGGNNVLTSSQLIFERRGGNSSSYEAYNLPIGFEGAKGGNVPTEDLAACYEVRKGFVLIDWENPAHIKYPFFGANGVQQIRDPRFYVNILCNGAKMFGRTVPVETFIGGANALPIPGATITGYYLKKFVNETVSLSQSTPVQKPHHYVIFRYAEILLNYAEALNEWKGADYTDDEFVKSARDAINEVRSAANMNKVTDTGDEFSERIRRERRIELAFEDHRFWDIRRWMIGDVVKEIHGLAITKNEDGTFSYEKKLIQKRIWDDKMYFYPIPQSQLFIDDNLKPQNPGW